MHGYSDRMRMKGLKIVTYVAAYDTDDGKIIAPG